MAEGTSPERGDHNFGAVLRRRAAESPAEPAYTFLGDGLDDAHTVTFQELHDSVCVLAARLAELPGSARALLLYPHGLEFIRAFWACLLAGVVPVPCYPPRNARSADRLLAIAQDAQAAVVLTDRTVLRRAGDGLAVIAPCLATDEITGGAPAAFTPAAVRPSDPAFLQYTSGSTGTPKGVVVSHDNLYRNQDLIQAAFGQDSDSTIVSWLPFYHDMGLIGNVLHSVYVGAHAVFLSPLELLRRPMSWLEAISHYQASGSGGPNFGYQHCADRITDEEIARLDLSRWRTAYCGAELVREPTLTAFADRFATAGFRAEAFRPCYGMAEATLFVAAANGCVTRAPAGPGTGHAPASFAPSAEPVVSCGVPGGFQCLIVDEDGNECPEGEVGEVWLSGESIAGGYWNNPEASGAFHAFTGSGRGPFYRTGDLGFLRDGELHVTGRLKELVIIRGRNHYPYDLEWAIAQGAPGVVRDGCVVFSVDEEHGEELIVQCEYQRTCGLPHDEVIRSVRSVLLEEFGIAPAEVFLVADRRLPRTSSGKLQRTLCKSAFLAGQADGIAHWTAKDGARTGEDRTPFPAESDAERLIARVVERLRGPVRIGRDDTFFGVGFDSLGLAELAAAVSAESGRAVGVELLFDHRTIPELAARLDTLPPAERPEEHTDDGPLPLSSVQESIWVDHQSREPDNRYNIPIRIVFPPRVPRERVEEAVTSELGRAELLACRVVWQDGRVGLLPSDQAEHPIDVLDLSALPAEQAARELEATATTIVREAFDLDESPLFRAVLARCPDGSHTLVFVAHHLVCDGFSLHTFAERLLAAADGTEPSAAKPDTSYRTYVRRQREALARDGREAAEHWRRQLADVVPLRLPRDRWSADKNARGVLASQWLHLTDEQSRSLVQLARRLGTTPFGVALTAFATVMGKVTRRSDVVIGTPLLDRELPLMQDTFGPCVNPVTLRYHLSDDQSGADRIAEFSRTLSEALRRRTLPVREAVGEAVGDPGAGRHDARTPLTSVYFNGLTFAPRDRIAAGFLGDQGLTARLDLDVYAILDGDGRGSLRWDYDSSLFDPDTVRLWMAGFETCLRRLAQRPDEPLSTQPLLPPRPVQKPDGERAGTLPPLVDMIKSTMARIPERVAVVTPQGGTTYGELLETSRRIGTHLRNEPSDAPIGLHFHAANTASAIAAMVGTLDAGRRYVVLEPRDPETRLRRIVADAGVRLVLADGDIPWAGDEGPRVVPIDGIGAARPHDGTAAGPRPGYLLYTSGTSGTPKGVIQDADNVRYFVDQYRRRLAITEQDTLSLVSSLGFDAAVLDVYTALVTGAQLRVLALHDNPAHSDLWKWVSDQSVTVLHATPSLYRKIMSTRSGTDTGALRAVVLGGEPVLPGDAVRHFEQLPGIGLHNLYGQAESTVNALRRIEPEHAARVMTLGPPCDGTTLNLLVAHGGGPEVYEVGEIVAGSPYAARGYLGLPDLSARKFLETGYRTGDLGRFLPSGEIELVGRADRQFKVNGNRVEPAEIETVLTLHPAVTRARVLKHRDGDRGESLTAYAEVPDASLRAALGRADLRDLLVRNLPAYMVPATVRVLDAFPLTPNNKIDTVRLSAVAEPAARATGPARPLNDRERAVAECVEGVLGVVPAGPEASFFELGGNSISVIDLLHRLERTTGLTLSFKDVFEAPTIAGIGARLVSASASPWPSLSRGPARAAYPATSNQTRIWVQDQRTSYNVLASIHVGGDLDPRRLERAIGAVVARHEILRTRFAPHDDGPVQHVESAPAAVEILVEHLDPDADQETALAGLEQRELHRRFDLAEGPLFQVTYVTGAHPHGVLMLSMHHIICDAISVGLFTDEVLKAYALRRGSLPEPAIQHGDYALWLQELGDRGLLDPSRAYWEEKFKDGAPALRLRTDRPRGPAKSFGGAVFHGVVDEALAARARDLCRTEGVTLFTLLHSVMALTLHNRTGQTDLCLGTLSTGREFSRHLNAQIGFLANTLALRTTFTADTTFHELLATARTEFLESQTHQLYPLERLAGEIPRPEPGHGFLFDILLVLQDWGDLEERVRRTTGLEIALRERRACVAKFDMTFNFVSRGRRVEAMVEFDPALYDEGSVALLWRRFTALLAEVADAPGRPLSAYGGEVEEERAAVARHEIDFDFDF
ncbi:AMP-binding protein [Streptomyces sp. NBC_00247]|uniref:condensation domain-containing protein n=1 Tax=Streptomyces sp. NBC_00247 TaxID=2975689 RepID=UPI002E2E156D|nr:condensation domain-containing protein [Streptomyces sp. NBC_00247]